jgi:hypothetical protein
VGLDPGAKPFRNFSFFKKAVAYYLHTTPALYVVVKSEVVGLDKNENLFLPSCQIPAYMKVSRG